MKYKINKEFFPFNMLKPPISEGFLKIAKRHMKPPRKFLKNKNFKIREKYIKSFDGETIKYFVATPIGLEGNLPCLIYMHGGGFVLEAARYHYLNALEYAKEVGCVLVFPIYRLAPKYPFPYSHEDCYKVFEDVYNNSNELNIDKNRIGLGGDSAGSSLSVGLSFMAKDRNHPVKFKFLMLPYPFLDARNNSESCRKYRDTPMWNSSLSGVIGNMVKVDKNGDKYFYYSCLERKEISFLPDTYIETCEFDCLHDDGISFYERLNDLNINVTLNETKGTIHGFDIARRAKTSIDARNKRIKFMKNVLNK